MSWKPDGEPVKNLFHFPFRKTPPFPYGEPAGRGGKTSGQQQKRGSREEGSPCFSRRTDSVDTEGVSKSGTQIPPAALSVRQLVKQRKALLYAFLI